MGLNDFTFSQRYPLIPSEQINSESSQSQNHKGRFGGSYHGGRQQVDFFFIGPLFLKYIRPDRTHSNLLIGCRSEIRFSVNVTSLDERRTLIATPLKSLALYLSHV